MNEKKKNIRLVAFLLFFLILIISITIVLIQLSRRVKMNTDAVTGNTTGNLNNKGLFCEKDDILYFANGYDNNSLYYYNANNGSCKKLADGPVSSINTDDNYIYFVREASRSKGTFGMSSNNFVGIYRMDKKGKRKVRLHNGPVGLAHLINNTIYYQNYSNNYGLHFFSVKIDGDEDVEIFKEAILPTGYYNGSLLYANVENNHFVSIFDDVSRKKNTLYEGDCYFPTVEANCLYYMDISNNYCLKKYNLDTKEEIILTTERLDSFNILGDTIFYQVSDEKNPCLKRMKSDGTNMEVVQNGIFHQISMTKNYTYFTTFNSDTPIYRTPTTGVIDVNTFTEALNAVD